MTRTPIRSAPAPVDSNGNERDLFADGIVGLRHVLHQRALFLAQDRAAADDLLQDTIERALVSRHRFRTGSNLRAWLLSIMRNLFVDGRRHDASARRQHMAHPGPRCGAAWVGDAFEASASNVDDANRDDEHQSETHCGPLDVLSADDLDAAIATLTPAQQDVFQVAYRDRVSHRAMAARLGVRTGTIATRLFRARATLRRCLEAFYQQRRFDFMAVAGGTETGATPASDLTETRS